jgi:DNA-binding IclR family transcriptional regulator
VSGTTTASVEAIQRAIQILDAFSVDKPELGVAEITRALGLKRSTVHRALATMEAGGLLRQMPSSQKYALGSKILKFAHVVQSQFSLVSIAFPVMRDLRDRFNETVGLHVLEGRERVVVQQVESTHDLRRTYHEIGKLLPLFAGSPGKVMLALLPPAEIRKVIEEMRREALTDLTLSDPEKLLRELETIRRQGYATSTGERSTGISSISCPIWNQEGLVVAAINISGPAERFSSAKALECLPALSSATLHISRDIGYSGPGI